MKSAFRIVLTALLATAATVASAGEPAAEGLEAAWARRTAFDADAPFPRYLRTVLCRLAPADCARIRLYVLEEGDFDLRISADGAIAVHAGTFLRLRDEDELAVLLGHELAHLELGHAFSPSRATRAEALVRQARERDADARGWSLAEQAGYDPGAAATFWARYARERRAARARSSPLSPYPPPDERAAAAPPPGPRIPDAVHRYRAAVGPHLEHWLALALEEPDLGATLVMLDEVHDDAPPEWRGRSAFALGEAHRRRAQAGDEAIASALFLEAGNAANAPAAVFWELGQAHVSQGRADLADAAFRRYRATSPPNGNSALLAPAATTRAPAQDDDRDIAPGLRAALGTRWERTGPGAHRRWRRSPDGAGVLSIQAELLPREHLLARRRVDRRADPGGWFDPQRRRDEWPRMLLAALRDAGWVDLRITAIRPQRFGTIDGIRFEYALAAPDGTPHGGAAAMLVRHGRLIVAYWQAPRGMEAESEAVAAAAVLDSLLPR